MSIKEIFSKINPNTRASSVRDEGPQIVEFDAEGRIVERTLLDKFFLALVIVLVSLGSFGLGMLSGGGEREPVRIDYNPEIFNSQFPGTSLNPNSNTQANTANLLDAAGEGSVVASKNGEKYHYPHCPGAKQIAEKNKITFASAIAAEQAGYTLAGNCKLR